VSSDFEGSEADDFSELKKITALLAKAYNRRKFYSKPTNNNLRTSSTSQSANNKQEFVKTDDKKEDKKADEKKKDMSRQTSSLKPYVSNVILEKIIIDLEDEVVNLLEKEKANLETIESLKSKGVKSSETVISESKNQSENACLVVEKECDKEENSKVIASGMVKLSVSQCVSPISMSKSSCESNNVEIKLKRKRRQRKSSKQNVKQVDNDVSRANSDFVYFSDLHTFSSVKRPKNSSVIWKKKGLSHTSNVDLSAVSVSNLNKNVKRYSRKDLLTCNNSHLGETSSASVCNDSMNVSCYRRMCDLLDDNNFFIFDDESIKISPVSKMPFKKKPRDSINICLWIIDSGCSKHMTGNRALLTNFVERFLRTVHFGNNDFAMIAGYGDVVIGSMLIKKVYYDVGKLKAKGDIGVFVGYLKESVTFRIYNKRTRKIHESVNVNFDEVSEMASKQFSLEPGLSNLNEMGKSSNPSVSQVTETSKKDLEDLFQDFYDEYSDSSKIMKSSITNVETLINEEVFHEVSKSFQRETSSSSLNDDVQQSPEEVILPQTNTQSISINMIPNGDEASTSYNVFNEQLKDAYFDASTSFHDPSNVHTYYQPYLHEKKLTKDHPLHKIIGDPKLSVRTRGQLENSCLFLCLLSFIEPANVAESLKDADWVSVMQEELDQFARLK
nr:integrase, catalytic region, zinc finger, CCHC-type, peptidase aspartic, catalytic [Tanacetum cinerariifolium]